MTDATVLATPPVLATDSFAATILIVDDEPKNRKLLELHLRSAGYRTESAASGEEALAVVAVCRPDLILLDVMMPGMDGYRVAARLKAYEATANIPIIMVTALVDRAARLSGLESGAEEFLTKPVDRVEVLLRVRNLLKAKVFGDLLLEHAREAQQRVLRLDRVYALLSQTSALIVRAQDRESLFGQACALATGEGGFATAWIGMRDASGVVAAGGFGLALSALALHGGKPVVCNDVDAGEHAPALAGDVARNDRIRACCVIPLVVEGEAVGVLALGSSACGVFDEEEVRLLAELAGIISYAIDHLAKQARLDYLAGHDVLTGLANRALFVDRLEQYMGSATSGGHKLALFLVDLERFKNINDTLGPTAGDALLRQLATWLTGNYGDASRLARVGADVFAVVLPQIGHEAEVARLLARTVTALLDHRFQLNDASFHVSAKVGVALFPDDGDDAGTLFRHAEAALKKAKATGDRYLFYTQKMSEAMAGKLSMENQLRQALERDEFVLYYQPKIDIQSGKLTSAEALIRWNDPANGLVPPGLFIPILEETGLIHPVGRWAIATAVAQYARWREQGAAVRIAVNVSPAQLRDHGFVAEVAAAIGDDPHAAAGLELEITEGMIMADVGRCIATLNAIRALGVTIAVDDFGTGFSSLSYLAKLPIDTLKIDRSFVVAMTATEAGRAMVSTIVHMGHSLALKVVAEGVETTEQLSLLRWLGCDEMQGYLHSRPMPAEEFSARFLA